jgi:hypothetical protein
MDFSSPSGHEESKGKESAASQLPEAVAAPVLVGTTPEQPPAGWRELVAVMFMVAVADATIYRGHGFGGYAVLFATAPLLMIVGSPLRRHGVSLWIAGGMLLLTAFKALWCGSWLLIAVGFALLTAFAAALAGVTPYVVETAVFGSLSVHAGYTALAPYRRFLERIALPVSWASWLNIALPLAAFIVFGLLFILANPDLVASFSRGLSNLLTVLRERLWQYAPGPLEALFLLAAAWISVGLLRPVLDPRKSLPGASATPASRAPPADAAPVGHYPALRNTLWTVIGLFAVYLVFEFMTLWFRTFPPGFYYAGYAHEGAAWLTVALALATLMLSIVFRGRILADPRLPRLRRLAWLWSAENMLLAAAVYHRLFIYIGFNGMTRMRTVGLFGISAVVAGFVLVLVKIARNRNFAWLLRQQLWALAAAIYLFALTPVDTLVVRYNVARILAGDPKPSVQLSVQPLSSEGVLFLEPALESEDELIREGIRALLAEHYEDSERKFERDRQLGWTTFQLSDRLLLEQLRESYSVFAKYVPPEERRAVLDRFRKYTRQWF